MKGKTRSFEKLYKAFIYVALITLAISIIVPVGWVFLKRIESSTDLHGQCQKDSTSKTLWMLGIKQKWVTTC